jgi:hypothetical protein
MPSISIGKTISGLGSSLQGLTSVTDTEGLVAAPTSVPAAQSGTLTTRTDATSGALTMSSGGHGITTGQRIDLYWDGGACYGAIAGTVSGTAVPIASVAGGDDLPSATTAITVGICTQATLDIVGDHLTALACGGSPAARSYFVFEESGGTDDFAALVAANDVYVWYDGDNGTNPLAGNTTASVWMSHASTSGAVSTMQAVAATH